MSFWKLNHPKDQAAVIQNGRTYTYGDLNDIVGELKNTIEASDKQLMFILCSNTLPSLALYLASLQGGQTACLLPSNIEDSLFDHLIEVYSPRWVCQPPNLRILEGYEKAHTVLDYDVLQREDKEPSIIHNDLALLLSTSGTTGNPKMVRLSYANLQTNAESIAEYLELSSDERPITTLPMQYSYGLSVINSHLQAGACLVLTETAVTSREFWDQIKEHEVTSIAGVPYIYQMLKRLRFAEMELPSLRTLTQAGGRLDIGLQSYFAELKNSKNMKFYVMYGQTEATARMSYIPPEKLDQKLGSIGVAIPGGQLELDEEGQLIYRGTNVMMGYAESKSELSAGDVNEGRLETGDLAEQDGDGYFYIVGRMKRFIKLFGLRINLDDVEKLIEKEIGQQAYCVGNDTKMGVYVQDAGLIGQAKDTILSHYHLHPTSFKIEYLEQIPRLETGKIDYKLLQSMGGLE